MTPIALLTSILLFASIFLLVSNGYWVVRNWMINRADRDARKYEKWGDELFLGWSHQQAIKAAYAANAAIVIVAVVILVSTGSLVFAAAAAFATYWIPILLYHIRRAQRLQRFNDQLPDAIDIMVSSARAGHAMLQVFKDVSIKMAPPISEEFQVIADEFGPGGLSFEDALRRARNRLKIESFTMMSSALIVNATHGGSILYMLEQMGKSTRELSKLQKKLKIETAEVRAQEKIILVMTPLFGGMICLFDPDIPGILFNTIFGNALLVLVAGLQIFAILWVRRIVRSTI